MAKSKRTIQLGLLVCALASVVSSQYLCTNTTTPLAVWEDVPAFSNDPDQTTATSCNSVPGTFGFQYECVEYVDRFFKQLVRSSASAYFQSSALPGTQNSKGFVQFPNGGSTAPEVDDVLVFDEIIDGVHGYGHVAVITSVAPDHVCIIEQNGVAPHGVAALPLATLNGAYQITWTSTFPVSGWVRAPLRIIATLDGAAWPGVAASVSVTSLAGTVMCPSTGHAGGVTYSINAPSGAHNLPNGTKVPDRTINYTLHQNGIADNNALPEGSYALSYLSGGPPNSSFVGVSPSSTQNLVSDGSVTFTMEFASLSPPPLPTWTKKCSPPALQKGSFAAMAYDSVHAQTVLFGGYTPSTNLVSQETWVWDGTSWTELFPANVPPARTSHAMAYDAGHGQVVMFGGAVGGAAVSATIANDTWVWDGTNWTQKFPAKSPSPRLHAAMVYDTALQRILLIGGTDGLSHAFAQTWSWDGTNWSTLAAPPVARSEFSAAYDPIRHQTVIFGGSNPGGYLSDTEVFDGTTWTSLSPLPSPPTPRLDDGLAFDSALGQTVLFGGAGPLNTPAYNDTWTWNGSSWMHVTPGTSPQPGRSAHAIAYDAARSQVVVFGGLNSAGGLTDTWVYGGTTTTSCQP